MELSPRLLAIAQNVPLGSRLADVGTDHGYLPVWLLLNQRIERAIASDLRPGPLDRARETAQQYGQSERISFRLCDGLSGISQDEADTIAIAGMGGETIAAILEAAPWTRQNRRLLLQPMTGAPELRLWLQRHQYRILSEEIIREGKRLYSIWSVTGGDMPEMSPAELWAGFNRNIPLRMDYLNMVEEKAMRALRGHLAAQTLDHTAVQHLEAVTVGLQEMKKELNPNDHSG